MNRAYQIGNYVKHWICARYTLGYNVHSPYLYDFTRNVIYETHPFYCFKDIENQRNRLLHNQSEIYVNDFGTQKSENRLLCDIAHNSLSQPQEGQLLFRIANYINATNILELGTSLGISTAYLASTNSKTKVTTLEGSHETLSIAKQTWKQLQLTEQISAIEGNINETLPFVLKDPINYDIIFFDANHTYDATIQYFNLCLPHKNEQTIFVFDDIYYSPEMQQAWQYIKQHNEVTATIDLYKLGLAFFNPYFIKKNYRMRW